MKHNYKNKTLCAKNTLSFYIVKCKIKMRKESFQIGVIIYRTFENSSCGIYNFSGQKLFTMGLKIQNLARSIA